MSFKISLRYRRLSALELFQLASFIHHQISTQPTVFVTPQPTMVDFKDSIDELQAAINNAGDGGKVMKEALTVAKAAMVTKMDGLNNYVTFTANGNREVAVQSGFPLNKTREQRSLGDPGTPVVKLTSQPGEVQIGVKKVTAAVAYMHQFTTDPLLKEEILMGMNCSSAKCKISGLAPGTVYYFRIGAIGNREQLLYSPVVSRMVA